MSMKKNVIIFIMMLLAPVASFAVYNSSIIYSFVDIAPDARSAALGDAVSSLKGANPGDRKSVV